MNELKNAFVSILAPHVQIYYNKKSFSASPFTKNRAENKWKQALQSTCIRGKYGGKDGIYIYRQAADS